MTELAKLEKLFHRTQKQLEAMPVVSITNSPTRSQIKLTEKFMRTGCASDGYIQDRTGLSSYYTVKIRKTF